MKHFFLTLLVTCGFASHASIMQFSGSVGVNMTWNVDTVQITGDVYVSFGSKLTINPGTEVQFMGYYMIYHSGCIEAIGTVTDSIRFCSFDTTGLSNNLTNNGGWKGMQIQSLNTPLAAAADSTIFSFCIFEHMKEGPAWTNAGININNSSKIRISDSEFRYNMYEHFFPAVYCKDSSSPIITKNYFHNNKGSAGGCIACFDYSSPVISWNVFYNNYADHSGGAVHAQDYSCPRIVNNFMCNNWTRLSNCGPADGGGAIRCIYGSNAYIANNVIANNASGIHGGAIECMYGADAIVEHNTIVNNTAFGYGAGIWIAESNVAVNNNIFWGNRSYTSMNWEITVSCFDSLNPVTPVIWNNCIEGDTTGIDIYWSPYFAGTISQNFDSVPQFISPSAGAGLTFDGYSGNWRLQPSSDCINGASGGVNIMMPSKDVYGNPRLTAWQYDVGAYEHPTTDGIIETNPQNISVFPNPCNGSFRISSEQMAPHNIVRVTVYASSGQVVSDVLNPVTELFHLPQTAGIYYVVISDGEKIFTTRIIRQ